jgi:hypothetical protein
MCEESPDNKRNVFMFPIGNCAFGSHRLLVGPHSDPDIDMEYVPSSSATEGDIKIGVSLHSYLHLVAGAACYDVDSYQILKDNIGDGVKEFLSSGICPSCFPD